MSEAGVHRRPEQARHPRCLRQVQRLLRNPSRALEAREVEPRLQAVLQLLQAPTPFFPPAVSMLHPATERESRAQRTHRLIPASGRQQRQAALHLQRESRCSRRVGR